MADEAIAYMNQVNTLTPDQPFFVYYAPGGTHAPHHPTPEWIKKATDLHLFDKGWNALRDQIFANQKKLGVIPQNAKMTPWPDDLLKKWDALSADEKKMFLRQVDVYAAYLMYTDNEIGRVIQTVEDMGKLDNTLIIYISGDNGSSAEGTLVGTPNEVAMFNGVDVPVADQLKYFYDIWGSDRTYNHMAVPWTWAFDTPFSWTKQIASHFGGVRQGTAISWPAVIKDKGGIRQPVPPYHRHRADDPRGHEDQAAHDCRRHQAEPDRGCEHGLHVRQSQRERAVAAQDAVFRNDGRPRDLSRRLDREHQSRAPAVDNLGPGGRPVQVHVGALRPAQRLDAVGGPRREEPGQAEGDAGPVRPGGEEVPGLPARHDGRDPLDLAPPEHYRRPQHVRLDGAADRHSQWRRADILNASYTFKADVEVPQGGVEGMLITQGGRFAGYGFYVLKGKPVFNWNMVGLKNQKWEGPDALAPGKHMLEFDFKYEGLGMGTLAFNNMSGIGRGGTGVLKVDGKEVSTQKMEQTIPLILAWDENLDVGSDTGTPVDDKDYQVPFTFTGKINKITLTIDRPQLSPADIQKLQAAQRNNKTSE